VVLLFEQAVACFVFPLRLTGTHFSSRDLGASQIEVGGSDNGYAHPGIDEATYFRVTSWVYMILITNY
jgi:hypothetical protein